MKSLLKGAFNKKTLSPDKIKLLEQFEVWIWDDLDVRWLRAFVQLKNYMKIYKKNCPNTYISSDGLKLGKWVNKQRANQNSMSPERKQRLDDIDFVWGVRNKST